MAKFMMSCSDPLLDLTDNIITHVRAQTGLKITRSGMIQILLGILVKSAEDMDLEGVYDDETLRNAIVAAIYARK
jgi:hypothetical protein